MSTTVADASANGTQAAVPGAEPTFEELAGRVDRALNAVAELESGPRAAAQELKDAVEAVHKVGLVSIVRRLKSDDGTRAALFELVDDPVVRMLLMLHGIVRPDPVTLANRALTDVRPQLQSHGGDVKLVRIEDGTAYVQLEGACNGCSMSSVTLRNLVETALIEGVPAVTAVEVVKNAPTPTLITLDALRIGPDREQDGWVKACEAADLAEGKINRVDVTDNAGARHDLIVVNLDQRLTAYRNACAHEGLPLDDAMIDASNGTLTCPWHGFCYDATSGECLSAPGAQLEQLPMRVDAGEVWIRVDA